MSKSFGLKIISGLVFVFIFEGCGSVSIPLETITFGNLKWNIIELKELSSHLTSNSLWAENKTTSNKFVSIIIEVENISSEAIDSDEPKLIDSKERIFSKLGNYYFYTDENLKTGTKWQPNMPVKYQVIYEVPKDATGFGVVVFNGFSGRGREEKTIWLKRG